MKSKLLLLTGCDRSAVARLEKNKKSEEKEWLLLSNIVSAKTDIKNKPLEEGISFLSENLCCVSLKEKK